jgi:hypothetical protein
VAAVSDDERNRFGVLLDHAAERGLVSPAEYQVRLTGLAEATSVDELQRIVTELPAFEAPPAMPVGGTGALPATGSGLGAVDGSMTPTELDSILWAGLTPAAPRRSRGNPWIILAVLVLVMIVSMVALALVAGHLVHIHGAGHAVGTVRALSPLHL